MSKTKELDNGLLDVLLVKKYFVLALALLARLECHPVCQEVVGSIAIRAPTGVAMDPSLSLSPFLPI